MLHLTQRFRSSSAIAASSLLLLCAAAGCKTRQQVQGGVAGHPIRVSWIPNPAPGDSPTILRIELDHTAPYDQPAAIAYVNGPALQSAPASVTIASGQRILDVPMQTASTATVQTVTAFVGTGGASKQSDPLTINPNQTAPGAASAARSPDRRPGNPALAAFAEQPNPTPQTMGHPIRVSIFAPHQIAPKDLHDVLMLYNGAMGSLYIDLPGQVDQDLDVTVTFSISAQQLLDDPDFTGEVMAVTATVPAGHRGVSILLRAATTGAGWVSVTAQCQGCGFMSGHDKFYVGPQPQ